ncbi:MAG: iron chaperone [Candidatus Acidiferrales bacterium]
MTPNKARPKTITAYIDAAPREARTKLREMRACIRKAAPGAQESLKWGMPAFSYRRILVTFAAFKHHIGFYPTPSAVSAFAKDLAKFATARGSIQFPLEKPLPLPLIRKITAFRVQESIEQDKKWRTPRKAMRQSARHV